MPANQMTLMTANEAASVTGVPVRQVHRIIDAGLLEGAVRRRRSARLLARKALVGLKLAHDVADVLTPVSRRAVVAALLHRSQLSKPTWSWWTPGQRSGQFGRALSG